MKSAAKQTQQPPSADAQERNRLLAEMAEQSTDMISRHTPDNWQFIYASPAVEHLLGYRVDEIVGMSAYELYHPDDVEDFKRRAPSVSYERGTYTHTYRFRRKDGQYTWLESTSRSIRDPKSGELKEILVVSRDASHRINAEQTNRRLARVLESSSDLVAFVDLQRGVTDLNEAARSVLAQDCKKAQVHLRDLFQIQSYQQLVDEGLPVALCKGQWNGESEMKDAQGQSVPVMLEILAHRAVTGQVEYFSLVARDMSAQRALEAERQRYQNEVSHSSRLITMGEMASGLAHELNQPLTAIVNYVRGIERRTVDQTSVPVDLIEKPLHKIASTALRAGEIIRSMMDFTRKRQPHRQTLVLKPLVDDVIQLCSTQARAVNVQLENLISERIPTVEADQVQLEQVLLNLLINAIEASADQGGSESAQVWVDAIEGENDQVIIRVHDQGCGLPEDLEQLFQQFYTTKAEGLGMGLAISRSLIEAHGGHLWAEPAHRGGAVFSFSLNQKAPE